MTQASYDHWVNVVYMYIEKLTLGGRQLVGVWEIVAVTLVDIRTQIDHIVCMKYSIDNVWRLVLFSRSVNYGRMRRGLLFERGIKCHPTST